MPLLNLLVGVPVTQPIEPPVEPPTSQLPETEVPVKTFPPRKSSSPTAGPTRGPTPAPSPEPTQGPTGKPSPVPTSGPTPRPTSAPTPRPTSAPQLPETESPARTFPPQEPPETTSPTASPASPTAKPQAPCFMAVDLTCTASDGTDCVNLVPPDDSSGETCMETICYNITIDNTGEVCMEITVANFEVDGSVTSVLEYLPLNPVCAGNSTSFGMCSDIDICTGEEFNSYVYVEANPPNGEMCQGDDEYQFSGMLYITQLRKRFLYWISLLTSSCTFFSI